MDVIELTRRLVSIPSISGDEAAVVDYVSEYLRASRFHVTRQQVLPGRDNIYATIGDPEVVLSTHTDTVPPYVALREDDEFLYGRGTCDAKGCLAAMIVAAERLRDEGVSDLGLLFVVGEEAGSQGARSANSLPNRSGHLINGEPTESRLAVGSKGALRIRITTRGRAAHSAYPHMGESAIDKLLDVLGDLRSYAWPHDPVFGETTVNIGMLKGGVAANVIPPEAEAELMFRVTTATAPMLETVEEIVASRAELECSFSCEPVRLAQLDGFDTTVVAYTSDVPLLDNWGTPLLFGPGSILDAHTQGEKISKRELVAAVDVYADLVKRLKGRKASTTERTESTE